MRWEQGRQWVGILLGLLCSHSALAISLQDFMAQSRPNMDTPANPSTASCADFSGQWVGQCQDMSENTHDDNIRIDQTGCQYLRIVNRDKGESSYEVGEARRFGRTSPATSWNSDLNEIALWSPDKSLLTVSISSTFNNMSTGEHWKDHGSQKFAFRAGKLLVTHLMDGDGLVNGENQTRTSTLICRYSKTTF